MTKLLYQKKNLARGCHCSILSEKELKESCYGICHILLLQNQTCKTSNKSQSQNGSKQELCYTVYLIWLLVAVKLNTPCVSAAVCLAELKSGFVHDWIVVVAINKQTNFQHDSSMTLSDSSSIAYPRLWNFMLQH